MGGAKGGMKGLQHLIRDIRNCKGREGEQKRVNKEMANIRKQFTENKNLTGYKKKKYVCKIIYLYMLGYDVDFGHVEAINLLSSSKFSEKQVGYLFIGVLLNEEHQLVPLVVQSISHDLAARSEFAQCLALTAIANVGGKQMAEAQLAPSVTKLLLANTSPSMVKKKAAVCLLQLYRKYPDFITPDVWADRLIKLLSSRDPGVVGSLMSLLLGIVEKDPSGYEPCVEKVIELLSKIVLEKEYPRDYVYYNVPNPWLQVKLLRFLRYFPATLKKDLGRKLHDVLDNIMLSAEKVIAKSSLSNNHKNALNAVLFEAIDLVLHYHTDNELVKQAAQLLGRFISPKESANIRYLGLEAMGKLALSMSEETGGIIKRHLETVLSSLKDPDISIRRRALDLCFGMCDQSNSQRIVGELLDYLLHADFDIQEELALKIAVLAEKFATSNRKWYVDTVLRLISLGGSNVPDDVWYRVVQIVTNHEDIQEYAVMTAFKALKHPSCGESTIKVAGYLLGEFGHLIDDKPSSSAREQFEALHQRFATSSVATRALLLSTYAKFLNLYPEELGAQITQILKQQAAYIDAEIQQRAFEYHGLHLLRDPELMQTVLDVMPAFAETDDAEDDGRHATDDDDESEVTAGHRAAGGGGAPDWLLDGNDAAAVPPRDPLGGLASAFAGAAISPAPVSPYPAGGAFMSPGSGGAAVPPGGGSPFHPHPASPQHQQSPPSPLAGPSSPLQPNEPLSSGVPTLSPLVPTESEAPQLVPKKSKPTGAELMEFFKLLCINAEGVLYEDGNIQIGLKTEFQRGMGRLVLYYGNTTNAPITQFTTIISPVNYLSIQIQEIASVIRPMAQEQQLINVACLHEFADALPIQVSYLANGKSENLSLRLPIVLTKFVEPVLLDATGFFGLWKKLAGPPYEHQSVFKAGATIDMPGITHVLSSGLHVGVLSAIDPNVNNLVAAGSLFTTTKQVLILLRIETNPSAGMIRLTIRSESGQVTAAIKNLVSAQLVG